MKWISALPLLGYVSAQGVLNKAFGATLRRNLSDNIYTHIGVRPIINARGPWTYISGSLELPEVKAAKQRAAEYFVDIWELQRAVGKRLAELSGAEAGMVTSGAAGAIAAATAACIAGTDPAKVWQLPDTTGLKSEVVLTEGRSAFDSAVRLAGGKVVPVRTVEGLQSALNANTAMVYTMSKGDFLEKILAVTKKARVPLLVDWADGIPPMSRFSEPAKMGVELYTVSGGKGLCGPQCAGVLLGRKDLIEAALANCSPWEGAVCRPMKVGKEEIMGMLAALEAWSKMDTAVLNQEWNKYVKRIATMVESVRGVTTEITVPTEENSCPTLTVKWDPTIHLTVEECVKQLRGGDPRIEVLSGNNPSLVPAVHEGAVGPEPEKRSAAPRRPGATEIRLLSINLQPGEDMLIGRRLREILGAARKPA
jgi:L-seryl-tRNA(Ser) seleniumtransferase